LNNNVMSLFLHSVILSNSESMQPTIELLTHGQFPPWIASVMATTYCCIV
jgi:hypothetical protein